MIANVLSVLAIASVAVAFPCRGVLNTGFGGNYVLNGGSCGSVGFVQQRPLFSGVSSNNNFVHAVPVVNAHTVGTGCNNNNNNNFGFGNNQGFTSGFVSGLNAGLNSGLNSGVNNVVSSSFGPAVFAADTRSVGFVNPRSGTSCGSANANVLGNLPVVSSQSVGGSLNAAPTQVSVDAPVMSVGCGNQMVSSQGSGLFSTGSLVATPAHVSVESGLLSSGCGNQMLSGSNNGLFGRCGF